MPLISCPDCRKEISSNAPSCPSCGAPIAGGSGSKAVVTTQATAKKYKGAQLLSVPVIIVGMVAAGSGGPAFGVFMLAVGVGLYIYGRFGAWWNHG